ncbi:Secretory lipase [Arthrobacter sp. yr096]|uniref:alpha/beta fold hydrolase n=1 Tax=Arthrobacter sp. yr096 TaxID=1761750 RepID=UPI0008D36CBD|nr:alpha/beta fold hydrolase [Arthrobacter sp. yr096]SEJ79636.1 Secretory lipase [Arthrobacter sp. yr096]
MAEGRAPSPEHHKRSRRRTIFRRVLLAALIVVGIGVAPGAARLIDFGVRVGEGAAVQPAVAPFYIAPTPAPGPAAPGTILRQEVVVGAPEGATAWRILYHSTDVNGSDTLVSGLVIAPSAPAADGTRTVVSWAHPTTGTAPRCAPSSGIAPFVFIEGLSDLLAAGHVVVATDYAGMGIAGPPSFLIGATEAANVLDIARAARLIEGAGASDRVVLWGHSQGGHASLFAAQRAASYAPELTIAGVAVAAPATNLGALLSADIGDVSGVTIGAYAFTSYAEAYASRLPGNPLASVLTAAGAAAAPRMAELCLLGQNSELHTMANPLIGAFVTGDPTTKPGWSQLLAENTPAQVPVPVPLFVAQGAKDTLVRPEITAAYVAAQTQGGTAVESHVLPDATHATVALEAMPYLMKWMGALL